MTLGEIRVQEIRILTEDLVTVQNAAKEIGITRMTLYRRIDAKRVVSIKLGGILFIPRTEIERLQKESGETLEAES